MSSAGRLSESPVAALAARPGGLDWTEKTADGDLPRRATRLRHDVESALGDAFRRRVGPSSLRVPPRLPQWTSIFQGPRAAQFFRVEIHADLALLDLNTDGNPSKLSFAGAQAQLDAHWHADAARAPLRLVGSSFGGTAALAYANRHPERVDRLLLLCPGFDLGARWESIVGADALAAWERVGVHTFALPRTGEPCDVPWAFVEESRRQPPLEPPPCPTVIVHATEDEVVPWTLSADFVERCPDAARPDLVLVDDDHALCAPASLAAVEWEAARLFEFESRDD